ncbi:SDR family oxidoreductase [Micromonospora sp. B11E3]|uniref:SDR family NAD(P)-dependent oxidoreductase n=1 Tax=Micromonospora sp. B11E3 TaxID=3153562 RepID=UPI00325D8CAA
MTGDGGRPGAALVTGGSRGIGRAIAVALARAGWDVAVNYRADSDAAQVTVGQVAAQGRRGVAVAGDVTDPDDAARVVARAEERLGPLGALVNNVGEFHFKPLGAMSYDEWRGVLDSNLGSAFLMSRLVLPGMRQRRFGRIVNIGLGPVHLVRAAPNVAAYAVAKTGVVVLTMSLAAEEAPYGIRVNCVSPGLIDNGFLPPEQAGWMHKRVPMGRLGEADEVAEAVAFLASDRASYVSGANLTVSGGWDWFNRPTDHDGDVTGLFLDGER